ncbi:succinylglutamate desuccinylase/aspartoacylase domain-containing protein [Aestuariibacter salexigens]|uniref:succinylglutamate desuccinylase/aspartoacylase domain-containing protein n=1 Tax=Aestuariibacter salexigens TaxID=226010 RepID=UPI00041EB6A6|nr:succinylglutamate desuccinylase/aspartoacylase family protein [Aestuariibacter salexigens]
MLEVDDSAMHSIRLNHIHNPKPEALPPTSVAFLKYLSGPTVIHVDGIDSAQTRIVVTLLHGNEPSGLRAIHHFLRQETKPATNVKFIIASVVAATTEPLFSHRMLPNQRDLNRCFSPPFHGLQGNLAHAILSFVRAQKPQAVIDMHNTSGSGPAFCVSVHKKPYHIALASHFAHWFIHTDIKLGALMEQDVGCPMITVECGGCQDEEADFNAYRGLVSMLHCSDVFEPRSPVEVLCQPRRLEIRRDASINFAERPVFGSNITICQDVEKYNFGVTQPGQILGWVDHLRLSHFRLDEHCESESVGDYFNADFGELTVKTPLKLFMVTTRADIAKSDCLMYFVKADNASDTLM